MGNWLGPGERRMLEEKSRRMLLSAWSDVGFGFYEWGVFKAWMAGVTFFDALLWSRGVVVDGGLSYRVATALAGCGVQWRCSVRADALVAPLLEPDALVLLEGIYTVGRSDVLDVIECVISLASRARECRAEPAEPAGEAARSLEALSARGQIVLADAGLVRVVALDSFRGLTYRERVAAVGDLLPPGGPFLLLEPEEAAAFLARPWRRDKVVVHRDDVGLAALLG